MHPGPETSQTSFRGLKTWELRISSISTYMHWALFCGLSQAEEPFSVAPQGSSLHQKGVFLTRLNNKPKLPMNGRCTTESLPLWNKAQENGRKHPTQQEIQASAERGGPSAHTFISEDGSVDPVAPQPGFGTDVVEEEPDVTAAVQGFLLLRSLLNKM